MNDLIRLAEEKDFLQLAEMKWGHTEEYVFGNDEVIEKSLDLNFDLEKIKNEHFI